MTLRVGIIGAGRIGTCRAAAIARVGGAVIAAVADSDRARAAQLAREHGCRSTGSWEAVATAHDLDAVVVATPHNWLAPVARAALESGKHVLCEKPLAMTPQQAEELVLAAERAGRKLKTGFNHRHHPALAQARQIAADGRIGALLFLRCRYGHGGRAGYDREWRADPAVSGGGELLDQGIHALDLFRWFAGEFSEVSAMVSRAFWPMPVEDNAVCMLGAASGQVAHLHASWTQWKNLFSFEVFGRDGYLIVDGLGGSYGRERLTVGRRPAGFGAPKEEQFEFDGEDDSWRREWEEFAAAIREDRAPLGDGRDGWQALRLVHAAYESARVRANVRVA